MNTTDTSVHGLWSRRSAFIFAAIGSAVGLGNIWKFPYMTGEYGGAAFVLVYLACVFFIGLPIMVAEITLGRRGRHSPVQTMRQLAKEDQKSPNWQMIGWLGMLGAVTILSFYLVIAGWTAAYFFDSLRGTFQNMDAQTTRAHFDVLVGSPWRLVFWHTLMALLTGWVIIRGVNRGIERTTSVLMPSLFALLLLLVGYAALYGDFARGLEYLFAFDVSKITPEVTLNAMGQAFFSLSIGMGAIMVYGAYLPGKYSIPKAAAIVVSADALVALLMGVALFPVVFASGMEPGAGPGLIFKTLVVAFAQMPGGWLIGTLFFALTVIAAWTSAISLMEPCVSWLVDSRGMRRRKATQVFTILVWFLGLGTVVSFNVGEDWTLGGRTYFDWMNYLSTNVVLPTGGILIAIYAGWMVARAKLEQQLDVKTGHLASGIMFNGWLWLVRVLVPLAVLLVMLHGLGLFEPML